MEDERIYRQKVTKIGVISIGICLLIAYWYATQEMAEDCGYSKLLGSCLSFGDVHIYPPYKFYIWQQDAELQKSIPEIIGSYAGFPYLGFVIGAGFTYLCAKNLKKETSHGSTAFATAEEIESAGKKIRRSCRSKSIHKKVDVTQRCRTYFVSCTNAKRQRREHDNSNGVGLATLNIFLRCERRIVAGDGRLQAKSSWAKSNEIRATGE